MVPIFEAPSSSYSPSIVDDAENDVESTKQRVFASISVRVPLSRTLLPPFSMAGVSQRDTSTNERGVVVARVSVSD